MPRTVYEYERIKTSVANQQILRSQGYTPVFSSNVSGIQRKGNDLYIRFHNASIYVYPNQGNRFNDLLLSPSKGKWVWRELRRKNVAYSQVGSLPLDGDLDLTTEQLEERLASEGLLVQAIKLVESFKPNFARMDLIQNPPQVTILKSGEIYIQQPRVVTSGVTEVAIKENIKITMDDTVTSMEEKILNRLINNSEVKKIKIFDSKFRKIENDVVERHVESLNKLLEEYNSDVNEVVFGATPGPTLGTVERIIGKDGSKYFIRDLDSKKIITTYTKQMESGYSVKVDIDKIEQATVTHEFAHTIYDTDVAKTLPENNPMRIFDSELKKIKREYISQQRKLIKAQREKSIKGHSDEYILKLELEHNKNAISDYARTNIDEFFAEAFTNARLSSNPSPYSIKVLNLTNKYLKKG